MPYEWVYLGYCGPSTSMRCSYKFWYSLVIPVRKAQNVPHVRVRGGRATLRGKNASLTLWGIQTVIVLAVVHEQSVAIWGIIEVLYSPLEYAR